MIIGIISIGRILPAHNGRRHLRIKLKSELECECEFNFDGFFSARPLNQRPIEMPIEMALARSLRHRGGLQKGSEFISRQQSMDPRAERKLQLARETR